MPTARLHDAPDADARRATTTGWPGVAAFVRFEGVLCTRPTLAAAGWLALNAQAIGSRLPRLGAVLAATPLALFGETRDDGAVRKLAWAALRDMSEDRLFILGREYADQLKKSAIRAEGRALIERLRREGARVVVISDGLDVFVRPVVESLGVDELVCNRMELRRGKATGKLAEPVVAGHVSGQWLRAFADERGLDLARSSAYGASAGDGLLLSAVGRPCAVSPDRTLRRMAKDLDWPVIESHDGQARI
jgi:HAD superfamily phosphoserine phosphatase-like hydrolase